MKKTKYARKREKGALRNQYAGQRPETMTGMFMHLANNSLPKELQTNISMRKSILHILLYLFKFYIRFRYEIN